MIVKTVFLAVFLFSVGVALGQRDSTIRSKTVDTVRVQTFARDEARPWYDSTALPAFTALAITLIGLFINIYIAKNGWKLALTLSEKQIQSNAMLASKEFNAKLHADNRQQWIIHVRDCISQLITQCTLLNIAFQEQMKETHRIQTIHEKVTLFRNQLRLLLNPEIPEHRKVFDDLVELMTLLDRHLLNSERPEEPFDNVGVLRLTDMVIESGRTVLYTEWQKIQNAQTKYFS
jgi:hypothetical protein